MKLVFLIYVLIYVVTLICCYIYNYRYNKGFNGDEGVTIREILGLDDGSHIFQHIPFLNTAICMYIGFSFIERKIHKYIDKFLNIKIK
jgi:coproporphyrinogen III oxidase-like Fe-S oxidoreductase